MIVIVTLDRDQVEPFGEFGLRICRLEFRVRCFSSIRDRASEISDPLRKLSRSDLARIVEPLVSAALGLRWCEHDHAADATGIEASAKRQRHTFLVHGAFRRLDLALEHIMRSARWSPRHQCRRKISVLYFEHVESF